MVVQPGKMSADAHGKDHCYIARKHAPTSLYSVIYLEDDQL